MSAVTKTEAIVGQTVFKRGQVVHVPQTDEWGVVIEDGVAGNLALTRIIEARLNEVAGTLEVLSMFTMVVFVVEKDIPVSVYGMLSEINPSFGSPYVR
ncbi:MAG TPA: hypothetical protein VFG51_03870 [Candidatus Saccharimonadia bacterium]|nr:hypothetical protein [Candidatus Saccharimonadia bacterium]